MRAAAFRTPLVSDGLPCARSAGEKAELRKTTAKTARGKPCNGRRPIAPLVLVATNNPAMRDLLDLLLGGRFEPPSKGETGRSRPNQQTEPLLPRGVRHCTLEERLPNVPAVGERSADNRRRLPAWRISRGSRPAPRGLLVFALESA